MIKVDFYEWVSSDSHIVEFHNLIDNYWSMCECHWEGLSKVDHTKRFKWPKWEENACEMSDI